MWLTRFAISRPVITWMVFIALAVFGIISYFTLGRSANPPGTDFPVVVVQANYPGASPDEMERLVIKPIEDQLDGIDNLDQMTASAQEGVASIVVQFKIDTNLDLAAIDVQRRVDAARGFMPNDLDPPYVVKNGASQPLLDMAVSSNTLKPAALADLVNNRLVPVLKQIPNVQTVDVFGALQREFQLQPDPLRLQGVNATLNDIFSAVQLNNANLPGGRLLQPTQEASVSIHADINRASDMLGIPLPVPNGANRELRLGDIATAIDGHAEQRSISHFNGEPRLYVEISRNINADEIKSTKIAREQIKKINLQFPQLTFHEIDAPADYTQASLNGVWQSLGEGVLLTAIVMLLFLHAWRNAAVVMLAIPTSILSTMVMMKAFGFHLDTMSLMGLSLIIGILVDDSIVVLENITRHRDLGEDPTNAAINGRSEIGSAAVAITMVDVVVFLPIAFLSGIVGKYLKEFALVVVVATLFSLFVSFTLTPMLAAMWSVRKRSGAPPRWLEFTKLLWVNLALGGVAIGCWFMPSLFVRLLGVFLLAVLMLNAFVQRYDQILELYRSRLLPMAMRHGFFVVFICSMLFLNAIMLIPGGKVAMQFDIFVLIIMAALLGAGFLLRKFAPNRFAPFASTPAPRDSNGARRRFNVTRADWLWALGGLVVVAGLFVLNMAIVGILIGILWAVFVATRRTLVVRNAPRNALRATRAFGTRRRAALLWFAVPAALAVAMPLLGAISFDFVPSVQTGHVSMTVTYPPGTPIGTTAKYVSQLENAILKIDGVETVSSTVGRKPFGWGTAIGGNYAMLNAETFKDRRSETNRVIGDARKLGYLVPGGQFQVQGEAGGGSGQAISYSLQGPEDAIGPAAQKVAQFLRDTPGSVNVQTSNEVAAPRLNVQIDAAKAAVLGVSPGAAATAARIAVDGAVATKVRTPDGLVDVRVQFPAQDRNTVQAIKDVRVRASDGSLVQLSNLATFIWTKAPTKIDRLDRERVVNVLGDLLPSYSLGAVTGPLEAKLRQPGFLPSGVRLKAQGDTQYLQQTMFDMGIALLTSFMLVYMLMVILYGSFLEPLIVMFSVPVAIVGALMALALMHRVQPDAGQSLNIISMLGVVMLFGLVAKNGILLVDYSNTLCKRGMRVRDAVLQAAATRFRPILMTTFAMVFGMLPLAFGFAEGAEWRQAMGTVIIGGLLSSLILTLFLVPMIYTTWIGYLESRADRKAMQAELREPALVT